MIIKRKRRDHIEIMYCFLEFLSIKPRRKTKIMYKINLSHKLLTLYLEELMMKGWVRSDKEGNYAITKRGRNVEKIIKKTIEIMEDK